MKRLRGPFLLLCLLGLGADAFRALRPVPSSEIAIRMPRLEKRVLPNGIELVVNQDSYLPLVYIRLVIRTGYAAEPIEQRGVTQLLYQMLFSENEGLLKALDALGTAPALQLGSDTVSVSVKVQSDDATTALATLARALREPSFEEARFVKLQQRVINDLSDRDRSPAAASLQALQLALYPANHPLHRDPRTLGASIARLKLENVQQAYRSHIVAKNLGVVIAGRIAPVVASTWVKRELAALSDAAPPVVALPAVTPQPRQEILILPYEQLSQTAIAIGTTAPPQDSPDAAVLDLAATWLSAHLGGKLREDKTISYSMSASYHGTWLAGSVVMQGSVDAKSTGYAVREIISQLFAATSETVSPERMSLYRGYAIRDITESFSSLDGTADAAESVIRHDANYLPQRIERIQKIDNFGVYKALRDYVKPKTLSIVVAGDPGLIQQQVKDLGLGTARILDLAQLAPTPH